MNATAHSAAQADFNQILSRGIAATAEREAARQEALAASMALTAHRAKRLAIAAANYDQRGNEYDWLALVLCARDVFENVDFDSEIDVAENDCELCHRTCRIAGCHPGWCGHGDADEENARNDLYGRALYAVNTAVPL